MEGFFDPAAAHHKSATVYKSMGGWAETQSISTQPHISPYWGTLPERGNRVRLPMAGGSNSREHRAKIQASLGEPWL